MMTSPIPYVLRSVARWITWHAVIDEHGKPTKRPDDPLKPGSTWKTWEAVEHARRTALEGIGFVLTDGPSFADGYLTALDMDACYDADTGELAPWAQTLLSNLPPDTYVEVTPSGTGLRAWCFVTEPFVGPPVRRVRAAPVPAGSAKAPNVQVFGAGRGGASYVTVSGVHYSGSDLSTIPSLDSILPGTAPTTPVRLLTSSGPVPSREEISHRVLDGDPVMRRLAGGDWEGFGASSSEAYHRLACVALRAAGGHVDAAADWLLAATAWGHGRIEGSREPSRYARQSWVVAEVRRAAAHALPEGIEPLPEAVDPGQSRPGRLLSHSEFLARRRNQKFLVRDFLPREGFAQIFGDPGAGKTPVAMSLAVHIALGASHWCGIPIERAGQAVYLVGEDAHGLGWRVEAEQQRAGVEAAALEGRFFWSRVAGALASTEDAVRWTQEIREVAPDCAIVVVDTQSRNLGDANENDTQDMTRFCANVALMAQTLGCLVVTVHHTGLTHKDRGRGSSVQYGALDAQFEVTREGAEVRIKTRKAKNWQARGDIVTAIEPRIVGVDDAGCPITAIALRADAIAATGDAAVEGRRIVEALSQPDCRLALVALRDHHTSTTERLVKLTGLGKRILAGQTLVALEAEGFVERLIADQWALTEYGRTLSILL